MLLTAALVAVLPLAAPPGAHADEHAPTEGVWPLRPRPEVVAGFDPPDTRWGAGHRGVDLAGRAGQPVRAAARGLVTFAGRLAGRGVVVVSHGTMRSTYEPVAASVSLGDAVAAGEVIGRLQVFGSHCFPRSCLHWGLIDGRERYLDPLTLVGAGPVRLLPLDGSRLWSPSPATMTGPPSTPTFPGVARAAGPVQRGTTGLVRGVSAVP